MPNNTTKRGIDPVILLSVIFVLIVLCLHHGSYTIDAIGTLRDYHVTKLMQKFSVGGFLFLSGFKLAKSKLGVSWVQFIKSRFYRIYLLYLLAVITFSITVYPYSNNGTIPSLANFLKHVFCLQAILPNYFQKDYLTIWFVSILFFCYIFFLLARKFVVEVSLFCGLLFSTFLSILIIRSLAYKYQTILLADYLELWLVLFGIGMIYPDIDRRVAKFSVKLLLLISIVCSVLLILFYNQSFNIEQASFLNQLIDRSLILLSILPLYAIAFQVSPQIAIPLSILNLLKNIYYISFCCFLFHRPIWTIMANLWSEKSLYQFLYINLLGVPLIFFISYLIQKSYNQFVAFIAPKN